MGTLRFLLACLVALSHVGWRWWGANPGVIAVVCFYGIAGFAMAYVWRTHYQPNIALQGVKKVVVIFWLDRILRLWPSYLFTLCLTVGFWRIYGIDSSFLSEPISWGRLAENIWIVPLNFFMWNHSDHYVFIPPAWSLSLELQFYFLLPWLMGRLRLLGLILSTLVACAAVTGAISTELWGYRLLPGVLFIFILGIFRFEAQKANSWQSYGPGLILLLGCVISVLFRSQGLSYNLEIGLGLLSLQAMWLIYPLIQHVWDNFLGELAYPIFLVHFPVWWFLGSPTDYLGLVVFAVCTLILAWMMVQMIERPMAGIRRVLRVRCFTSPMI